MSNLVSLTPPEAGEPGEGISWIFYITSMSGFLSCVYVICGCLYMGNWAPGLALRGPTGSMSRAFDATRGERTQVNVCFVIGLLAFGIQTVLAVWILDGVPGSTYDSIVATVLMGGAALLSLAYLMRMHERFFGVKVSKNFQLWGRPNPEYSEPLANATSPERPTNTSPTINARASNIRRNSNASIVDTADADRSQRGGGGFTQSQGDGRMPLLDNPVAVIESHPDVSGTPEAADGVGMRLGSSEFEMMGSLFKQDAAASQPGETEDTSRRRRNWMRSVVSNAIGGEWRERFFVLRDGQLRYWRTEADYQAGKPSSEPIQLGGYEVLVDMASPIWGFSLQPNNQLSERRTWNLRAPSEQLRLEWSRRLVISTIVGSANEY